jgi:hypothetical protein
MNATDDNVTPNLTDKLAVVLLDLVAILAPHGAEEQYRATMNEAREVLAEYIAAKHAEAG